MIRSQEEAIASPRLERRFALQYKHARRREDR
jgi:hypothetical protein